MTTLPDVEDPATTLLPRRRRDADCRWWVVHVRSRQEKLLEAALRAQDVDCWVPLRTSVRRRGPRTDRTLLPVFPGYLFLWGARDATFVADRTRRVARVLDVPDQERLEWELDGVRRALASGALLEPAAAVPDGVRVRVVAGPFEGVEGVVRTHRGDDRLVLQVRMIGTAASLDIAGALVEPLGA